MGQRSPLAESSLRYDQELIALAGNAHPNDGIGFSQPHCPHSPGGTPHNPRLVLFEPDGLSLSSNKHDVLVATGQTYPAQLIAPGQPDSFDATGTHGSELLPLHALDYSLSGDHEEIPGLLLAAPTLSRRLSRKRNECSHALIQIQLCQAPQRGSFAPPLAFRHLVDVQC